jgi:methionine biosynthesis protein MetW
MLVGYESARPDVQSLVPASARAILDLGCSNGALGAALKARQGATVLGVELGEEYAREAEARLDRVIVADAEAFAAGAAPPEAPFDCVIAADVLEHLRDPWAALGFLATLLRPGGTAAVSVPNVAHWTGRRALLRGRFPYAEHGLFDRTHLRFFTRAGARDLVASAGLRVRAEHFAPAPLPLQSRVPALARFEPAAARAWPELFALQVVLVCEPAVSGPSTPGRASR